MNRITRLEPPLHSLEPRDWFAYSNLLQGQVNSTFQMFQARQIGESLQRDRMLVLVLHCPEDKLAGHWLQVGRTWFIPVSGTLVSYCNDMQWWRPEWVRAGFAHYPHEDRTDPEGMIRYASGTPFQHDWIDFPGALEKFGVQVTLRFFETHRRDDIPQEWI
jgi:hypothetical protein